MSTDPSAQLRHELRTPLNHIVGYAELLLEELQGDSEPDLAAGLAALRADARQLLTVLNEVLARGQAGPSDLAAARDTLRPLLERVRSASTALHRRAAEKAAAALLPDLDRIGSAVERLDQLLRHGGVPPAHEDGRPAAHHGAPSSARRKVTDSSSSQFFAKTGHTISGRIASFWEDHGDLPLPHAITAAIDELGHLRTYPWEHGLEAFFAADFERRTD